MKVSLDGGVTYQEVKNDVRIIYDVMIPGEDGPGQLHVMANSEGIVYDVWSSVEEDLDTNAGTDSRQIDDIVGDLCEENS